MEPILGERALRDSCAQNDGDPPAQASGGEPEEVGASSIIDTGCCEETSAMSGN